MNIPKGWPTVAMVSAAYNSYMRSDNPNTAERFTKVLVEALSAAPTPPVHKPQSGSWIPVQEAIDEYLSSYELDDGEVCHIPDESESFLISDAVAGLVGDEKFREEFGRWLELSDTPTPPSQEVEPVLWIDPINYKAALDQQGGALRYVMAEIERDGDIPLYAHPPQSDNLRKAAKIAIEEYNSSKHTFEYHQSMENLQAILEKSK